MEKAALARDELESTGQALQDIQKNISKLARILLCEFYY
jgi:hypothetical protein